MFRLKTFWQKYFKQTDGATAVEFGLVALPFLLTIFGVMETGRMMWAMNSIHYTVEETARYASINSDLTNAEFSTYAQDKMDGILMGASQINMTSSTFTSNGIDFIEVEGTYQMDTMISGLLPEGFGSFEYSVAARNPVIQ
ncbi:MAG: pilus assembly protein [Alphaproteobacteria bacterium]|nr:pilus assembly protein [Alphaproteobacteria bacterium]